jgi:hypothetical protein
MLKSNLTEPNNHYSRNNGTNGVGRSGGSTGKRKTKFKTAEVNVGEFVCFRSAFTAFRL